MCDDKRKCPDCDSENVVINREHKTFDGVVRNYRCLDCGRIFS